MQTLFKRILRKGAFRRILEAFVASTLFVLFVVFYLVGLFQGYNLGVELSDQKIASFLDELGESGKKQASSFTPTPTGAQPTALPTPQASLVGNWGGPELWEAVNKRREEFGVNPLSIRSELCTIASIRLNQLLELGTLDGHEGFSNMSEERPDLKWIFEKYSNISEFLAKGGQNPEETVSLWEATLGHRKLLDGGEYVWGCIYAQNTYAVAIAAY